MATDERERDRRRTLLRAHYAAENGHDLDGIMKTFSGRGEMLYNRQAFGDAESIRQAHGYIGFAPGGAFDGIESRIDREHFTDDEVIVEGRLCGRHVGEFQGFPASGRAVELPFVAFYRFDEAGKLASERVVMDLGTLAASPTWKPD